MVCEILISMCKSVKVMLLFSRFQDNLKTLKAGLYVILSAGAIQLMMRNVLTLGLDLEQVNTR